MHEKCPPLTHAFDCPQLVAVCGEVGHGVYRLLSLAGGSVPLEVGFESLWPCSFLSVTFSYVCLRCFQPVSCSDLLPLSLLCLYDLKLLTVCSDVEGDWETDDLGVR